jgi:hypothetical protein
VEVLLVVVVGVRLEVEVVALAAVDLADEVAVEVCNSSLLFARRADISESYRWSCDGRLLRCLFAGDRASEWPV